jgi:uracil phosphoribosyltransferase
MQTLVVDHPLVAHKLTMLREEATQAPTFRRLADELVTLLAYEAMLPTADVGFVGMVRDEESLVASTYADRLPADLSGREVFVLDPMLATGGTLETVIGMLAERGAAAVTAVCLLAAPEGVARLGAAFPTDDPVRVRVVTAAMDERLNERGYIIPGLGDAGDRLFGRI